MSVRMRASRGGKHVSGGETLAAPGDAGRAVGRLLSRIGKHSRGCDTIVLTRERIRGKDIRRTSALRVGSLEVGDARSARVAMRSLLLLSGVSPDAAAKGLRRIERLPIPGAAVFDAVTGEQLDSEPAKGVRVTRVGWGPKARTEEIRRLAKRGIRHRRAIEAIALATKIARSGAVAEVCRSDDPAYLTGYVASKKIGYIRVTPVKERGDGRGGRVIFVKRGTARAVISFLTGRPVIVDRAGGVSA